MITIVSGNIDFKKNISITTTYKKNNKKTNSLLYFKTAKRDYDRRIEIHLNSLINHLFLEEKEK